MEMHIDVTQHNMYTLTRAVVVSLLAIPLWMNIFTYISVSLKFEFQVTVKTIRHYSKMNFTMEGVKNLGK